MKEVRLIFRTLGKSTGRPELRIDQATSALHGVQQTSKYMTSLLNTASPIVDLFSDRTELSDVHGLAVSHSKKDPPWSIVYVYLPN